MARFLLLGLFALGLLGCSADKEISLDPKPPLPVSETARYYHTALAYYLHHQNKEAETFARYSLSKWEQEGAPRRNIRLARELLARALAEQGLASQAREQYVLLDKEFPDVPSYRKALETLH